MSNISIRVNRCPKLFVDGSFSCSVYLEYIGGQFHSKQIAKINTIGIRTDGKTYTAKIPIDFPEEATHIMASVLVDGKPEYIIRSALLSDDKRSVGFNTSYGLLSDIIYAIQAINVLNIGEIKNGIFMANEQYEFIKNGKFKFNSLLYLTDIVGPMPKMMFNPDNGVVVICA